MHVYDTIYAYDESDKEHKAEVIRITEVAGKGHKVYSYVEALVRKTNRVIYIAQDEIQLNGWDWSTRPVPPTRKGAVVQIKNWDRMIECKVLGLVDSKLGSAHADYFAYEGIRTLPSKEPLYGMGDIGRIKGHRFTASTECVKKIIKNGTGRRLLLGPFLTEKENREIFKDLYS